MGLLVDGKWVDQWYDTKSSGGRFVRKDAAFRSWVTRDGAPGPSGDGGFRAEAGRYHLYVAYACPWAHRTLIYRQLKGLTDAISVSFVHWFMGDEGWTFEPDPDGIVGDQIGDATRLFEVYLRARADHTGRVTVPVLWDMEQQTIVSNESSEIIRMFDEAFTDVSGKEPTMRPEALREQIDELNDRIYHTVNNGVYKSGFATTQEAYEEAVRPLFETLNDLDRRLANSRFLLGDTPTEADWRLFPTLLRFDPVYVGHFKCSLRRLSEYENLWPYTRDLFQTEGIAETINMEHTCKHYYQSHESINPTRIVPIEPEIDWFEPHGRG
ncbi:MAG: glutathione S-transferase family protein [Pseudomonadota bacterium]